MASRTLRRRLLWAGVALVLLIALRFVLRWADATGRLPSGEGLIAGGVTVLLLAALAAGAVQVRRQTRKNR